MLRWNALCWKKSSSSGTMRRVLKMPASNNYKHGNTPSCFIRLRTTPWIFLAPWKQSEVVLQCWWQFDFYLWEVNENLWEMKEILYWRYCAFVRLSHNVIQFQVGRRSIWCWKHQSCSNGLTWILRHFLDLYNVNQTR